MKPKTIEEETDEVSNIEFSKRTNPVFRCFENRDNFKQKSTLRNIARNQTKFKDKIGAGGFRFTMQRRNR
jgi:hypothetical protein